MNHVIVTESCSNIRKAARQGLSGHWDIAILSTLLFFLAFSGPTMVAILIFGEGFGTLIGNIYILVTGGAFVLGLSYFIMRLFRGEYAKPVDIFYGFDHILKAALLYIVMGIFVFLWSLLLIIPGIIAAYRYRLAYYIMLDNPNMATMEIISESKRLMRGNKGKLFILDLSFIGWGIIATITFGIGYLALVPYMNMAYFVFYELCNMNISPKAARADEFTYSTSNAYPNSNSNLQEQATASNSRSQEQAPASTIAPSLINDSPKIQDAMIIDEIGIEKETTSAQLITEVKADIADAVSESPNNESYDVNTKEEA